MNSLFKCLIPFIDLTALSSLVGTVILIYWFSCPACGEVPIDAHLRRCRRVLMYCLIGLSISSMGMLLQRGMAMADLGITEIVPVLPTVLFNSHYGSTWLVRAAGIVAAWAVWLTGKRHLKSRITTVLLLLACAAITFARSASSHAADFGDFTLQEFSDWFHLLGALSWGGILLAISLLFPMTSVSDNPERQRAVAGIADRFFYFFGPLFTILVFTGMYNSWGDVGSFRGLVTNAYGRFLSVKLLIFLYLASRYIAPPQQRRDETSYALEFLRHTRTDAFLILAILLFVALFTQEVPARHAVHLKLLERQSLSETGQGSVQGNIMAREQRITRISDNGLFSVVLVTRDKDLKVGVNSFDVIVHDKGGKGVTGAGITIVPWMPDMGHGVFEKPVVTDKGDGIYSVENVLPIMSGHWELRMKIRKDNTEDNVIFPINVSSEGN